MPFSRVRAPWLLFGLAVFALLLIAVGVDNVTTRLQTSDYWVAHTHEVETEVAELRSDIFSAEDSRLSYITTSDQSRLDLYDNARQSIPIELARLAELTADNPTQQERIVDVRPLINRRLGVLQESINLQKGEPASTQSQADLTLKGQDVRNQVLSILQAMETEEEQLLQRRETISAHTYRYARIVLAATFVGVLLLLVINFRRLLTELRDRTEAEEAVRGLSAKILQVQDAERRKVARELHDSIGQIFAALRMNLSTIEDQEAALDREVKIEILNSSVELVDQGLKECRTLSHLLHPPLLEDLGFASAAKWLVEGFSQRSGIAVNLNMPGDLPRLPQDIELALFRVLQEGLTNVHRHSGSASADAEIRMASKEVVLVVRDHGRGIPADKLEGFKKSSAEVGVGLAGMRERIHEIGGRLELDSKNAGTTLRAIVPLDGAASAAYQIGMW